MPQKRFLTIIIIALAALAASAQATVVDTLPPRMAWAVARVRVDAPGMGPADWTATLGDTTDCIRVRMHVPTRQEIYGRHVIATASRATQAGETLLGQAAFDSHADRSTLRVVYDGISARLYVGETANTLLCRVDSLPSGPIAVTGAAPAEAWVRCLPIPDPEPPLYADAAQITAHLAASADPYEGQWRYLDRDMDDSRATLAANYTLATVRAPDGTYQIIQLAPVPLKTKGRLRPTIFIGHFDLDWRDAAGMPLADETNAQFTPDGSILTLRFPLHKSQLRFSRIR